MSFYFLFLGRIRRPAPLFLSVPLPAILHDGVHGVHLFLHVLRQRDLAAGPDQVVLRGVDLEVLIPRDVVVQEARRQLARQRKAAVAQRRHLRLRQRGRGLFEEPLRERPVDVQVQPRPVRLRAVLLHEVRRSGSRSTWEETAEEG